jgi:hypothetical protein
VFLSGDVQHVRSRGVGNFRFASLLSIAMMRS